MKHVDNHDETKTQNRLCKCGHKRFEHEIYPDEHCYKCGCKQFVWMRYINLIKEAFNLATQLAGRQNQLERLPDGKYCDEWWKIYRVLGKAWTRYDRRRYQET